MIDSRKLVYSDADILMLCCAVNNKDSQDVLGGFNAEFKLCNSTAPIILVGTKSDMRQESPNECTLSSVLKEKSK